MFEKLVKLVVSTGHIISSRRDIDANGGEWQGEQLKTVADQFAHNMLQDGLSKLYSVPIISEENPDSHTDKRPSIYWLIDPIDGTRSLVEGFPGWVVQVALVENGKPIMSVIFAPDLDLLYTAQAGMGAYCNEKKLTVVDKSNDRRTLIDNYPEPRGVAINIMKGMSCTNYVESGSISLKICRVADGTADIFIKDVAIRDWDVAAPMLILKEMGGTILQYNGALFNLDGSFQKNGLIVVRSNKLASSILEFLNEI